MHSAQSAAPNWSQNDCLHANLNKGIFYLSKYQVRGLNAIRSTLPIINLFLWSESDGVTGQNFGVHLAITCRLVLEKIDYKVLLLASPFWQDARWGILILTLT